MAKYIFKVDQLEMRPKKAKRLPKIFYTNQLETRPNSEI